MKDINENEEKVLRHSQTTTAMTSGMREDAADVCQQEFGPTFYLDLTLVG
jgi:hypothetical protein